MSHTRVKMNYEVCGSFASTEVRTLYCHHNHSADFMTFYEENGSIADMFFESWSSGKDKWDAMIALSFPFKNEWGGELLEGVEYYYKGPWEDN
jgi:hypothetical protein